MANEASIRDRLAHAIDFTVADGTGIEKGTLLKLTDPRTAVASDTSGDVIAGIAAREKVASDGRTRLSVFTKGIFDMHCSGAVALGEAVVANGGDFPNSVAAANSAIHSGAQVIGYSLETAADNETAQIMVSVGGGSS